MNPISQALNLDRDPTPDELVTFRRECAEVAGWFVYGKLTDNGWVYKVYAADSQDPDAYLGVICETQEAEDRHIALFAPDEDVAQALALADAVGGPLGVGLHLMGMRRAMFTTLADLAGIDDEDRVGWWFFNECDHKDRARYLASAAHIEGMKRRGARDA